jgi:hypothetical protein
LGHEVLRWIQVTLGSQAAWTQQNISWPKPDPAMLFASRTRTGLGYGPSLESWTAFCKTNASKIHRELSSVETQEPALTQARAGLTTILWASSMRHMLVGLKTTNHVLQFYSETDWTPKVRDLVAWHVLHGTERNI